MYIKDETKNKMIELIRITFQGNSHSDNCAYWLDYNGFVKAQDIFHHSYAHIWGVWADQLSDFLLKVGVRPTRLSLMADTEDYGNLSLVFEDVKVFFDVYENFILEIIEIAELNDDRKTVVFLENFLDEKLNYLKQVNIWVKKAKEYEGHIEYFDNNFENFTII